MAYPLGKLFSIPCSCHDCRPHRPSPARVPGAITRRGRPGLTPSGVTTAPGRVDRLVIDARRVRSDWSGQPPLRCVGLLVDWGRVAPDQGQRVGNTHDHPGYGGGSRHTERVIAFLLQPGGAGGGCWVEKYSMFRDSLGIDAAAPTLTRQDEARDGAKQSKGSVRHGIAERFCGGGPSVTDKSPARTPLTSARGHSGRRRWPWPRLAALIAAALVPPTGRGRLSRARWCCGLGYGRSPHRRRLRGGATQCGRCGAVPGWVSIALLTFGGG